jgi:hypothetical protein
LILKIEEKITIHEVYINMMSSLVSDSILITTDMEITQKPLPGSPSGRDMESIEFNRSGRCNNNGCQISGPKFREPRFVCGRFTLHNKPRKVKILNYIFTSA